MTKLLVDFAMLRLKNCFLDLSSYRTENSQNYEIQYWPDIKIYIGI